MSHGKSIELFLVNGTADSLVIAELSNWSGKAIKIPRIEIASCYRNDITQAGVYFLFCKEDDGSDSVYIGESENVKERLIQHIKDYQAEKEKFYWNTAVIFVGRDLNKTLARYLERRLVDITRSSKRYAVLTKCVYRNNVMKESQIDAMEEFIDNIKILINVLGYKVLESFTQVESLSTKSEDELFYLTAGFANASGKVTTEGFVVYEGATINEKTSTKLSTGMQQLRKKLFDSDKVQNRKTTEDILFSSSSAAADFILGYSVSGPKTWKTKDGRTLKEIENEQVD